MTNDAITASVSLVYPFKTKGYLELVVIAIGGTKTKETVSYENLVFAFQ